VIVATGGLPQLPSLEAGSDLVCTTWDILSGDVKPAANVVLFDDWGNHSSMSAAEQIARAGSQLEIVTPERMLAIEVGGMNHVPYARAFNETSTTITVNQRLMAVRRSTNGQLAAEIGSDHSAHRVTRIVDQVVVDHGTAVNAGLYFDLKPQSTNLGAVDYGALVDGRPQTLRRNDTGTFQLFRIGDAVAARNVHAGIYDALRLMKDL
jgi:N-methyl-L-proline demethylase